MAIQELPPLTWRIAVDAPQRGEDWLDSFCDLLFEVVARKRREAAERAAEERGVVVDSPAAD